MTTPRPATPALVLLALLPTWACQDQAAGTGWTSTRETLPSGIEHITHTPPADPAPTWTVVEELRVAAP